MQTRKMIPLHQFLKNSDKKQKKAIDNLASRGQMITWDNFVLLGR